MRDGFEGRWTGGGGGGGVPGGGTGRGGGGGGGGGGWGCSSGEDRTLGTGSLLGNALWVRGHLFPARPPAEVRSWGGPERGHPGRYWAGVMLAASTVAHSSVAWVAWFLRQNEAM